LSEGQEDKELRQGKGSLWEVENGKQRYGEQGNGKSREQEGLRTGSIE